MRNKHLKLIITNIIVFAVLFAAGFFVNRPVRTDAITIDGLDFVSVTNYAFDVRGKINGSDTYNFQTTYANAGYSINFVVDGVDKSIKSASNGTQLSNNGLIMTLTEEQTAAGVDVHLYVENTDDNDHSYRVALTADIQLGSNDYAAIYKQAHSGLVITQDNPQKASDYGAKVYIDFTPAVDTSWIGFYKDRDANKYLESSVDVYTVADNLDTGAAWSWTNTLSAGENTTLTTSYKLVETESSTIKFFDKNGDLLEEKEALVGGSVTLPDLNSASDGYVHAWCENSDGTGVCYDGGATIIVESEEVNLHEVDSPRTYSLTYDLQGGTLPEGSPTTYNVESDFTLPAPTKTGYTFAGWTSSENSTPERNVVLTGKTGDKIYVANYTVNQYTLTLDAGNGSDPTTLTGDYGSTVTLPTPEKTGHTFSGWYSDPDFTTEYTEVTFGAEDLDLYAKWTVNQYTITLDPDNGDDLITLTADYGSTVPIPASLEKTGYTFAGWYLGEIKIVPDGYLAIPAEDATISARWTVNDYAITLDAGNGSDPTVVIGSFGDVVDEPDRPTRPGYLFLGWFKDGIRINFDGDFVIPAEDVTVTAKWTVDPAAAALVANLGIPNGSSDDNGSNNDNGDNNPIARFFYNYGNYLDDTNNNNSDASNRSNAATPSRLSPLGVNSDGSDNSGNNNNNGRTLFAALWDVIKTISPFISLLLLFFIFFLLFKRRDDDDDEEEEGSAA